MPSIEKNGEMPEAMEIDLDDPDSVEAQMNKMMGFGGFKSTKNTKVPGNDKLYAVRKEKKTEYRQYMNRHTRRTIGDGMKFYISFEQETIKAVTSVLMYSKVLDLEITLRYKAAEPYQAISPTWHRSHEIRRIQVEYDPPDEKWKQDATAPWVETQKNLHHTNSMMNSTNPPTGPYYRESVSMGI
ncbi:hypothetical protein B0A49_01032 [Cryomyces minteri]|uniref:U4/U6.U5 small nuclear ribonucleoprotein 27kDa protein domain-containing protein n=1 Tax=Cryomyces minteri TaxID=331657 RepID=A0A4U0XS66_9PEZI|nr:hypothetical protein B0A49_01032 [Cryomyces minteri]